MNSGLMRLGKNWFMIGLISVSFILVLKGVVNKYNVPEAVKTATNAV